MQVVDGDRSGGVIAVQLGEACGVWCASGRQEGVYVLCRLEVMNACVVQRIPGVPPPPAA